MNQTLEQKYETVIGLEVHLQLSTRTKIFAAAPTCSVANRTRKRVRYASGCREHCPF